MNAQVMVDTTVLAKRMEALVAKHGTMVKAAEEVGVSLRYFEKLKRGERANPSAHVLHNLGLTKVIYFKKNP